MWLTIYIVHPIVSKELEMTNAIDALDYTFSLDDGDWSSADEDLDTVIGDHLFDLIHDAKSTPPESVTVYRGVKDHFSFKDFLDVDQLIEHMQSCAYDNAGEYADDYLGNVTKEQKQELELLVLDWARKHELSPNFYLVKDIKEMTYNVEKGCLDEEDD